MIKQLIIKLDNKPGTLKKCVGLLSENGIDIKALELTDRGKGEFGEAHLIVSDLSRAIQVIENSEYDYKVEEVIVVEMDDRVGGLAAVLEVFERNEINIRYLYAFVSRLHSKSLAVIRVDDLAHAESLLSKAGAPLISQKKIEAGERRQATFSPSIEDHFGGNFIW